MGKSGFWQALLDFSILAMAVVYFLGFVSFHPESVFLEEAPYSIPHEYEAHFEVLLWVFFCALVLDLVLKYRKLDNWRVFVKKHWHDVVLLALIPLLSAFKIAKFLLKAVKTAKASKSGFKVVYKAGKASKHLRKARGKA